ncbi:MAG: UTP--glucose-1-phosphate uridylyltransferase [Pseudomonadota bacterium]
MTALEKIVIPVAGLGTRVLPASKAIPKELLPVVDQPVIQYVIEEAVGAGFKQIILVTSPSKLMIEQHFMQNAELEQVLESKGKSEILDSVRDILPSDVSISTVYQNKPLGLGHAVLCAAPLVDGDDFAVSLPDVLVFNEDGDHGRDLRINVDAFHKNGAAQIMVETVPDDQVNRYGIVDCGDGAFVPGISRDIAAMVEKPSLEDAPSNQSIIGRYVLPGQIMDVLQNTSQGAGGEIQLTDAMNALIGVYPMQACSMFGKTYDCGNKLGYLVANVIFGLQHTEIGSDFKNWLNTLEP